MSANLGSLVYFIRAKNQEFIQTMKDTENKLKDTKNEFERTSRKIKEVGTTFTVAGAAIIGTIIGLTGKSRELNAELANIGTLIPGNIKRLKELKNEIRNVAIETGKSTKDLAAGTYQLISAFGDTTDTIDKLKVNAKAAKAGIAETTDAINLTSAVTKAYGDVSAEATQKMTDLAFMTVKLGQTTFPELAQSIGKVAPFAAQLNISAEEMFNTFATLTGVTGQTAEVSTQVAALVRAFLTQTEDMKAAFKELKKQGYETASQLLADKGLVGALKAVIATTEGSDEAIAKLFGSAESLLAVFALTGSQADTFSHKLEQMKKASGALDEAFKEQTKGINEAGHKWEQTMIRMEIAVQRLGDVAAPAFAVIAGSVETLLGWLEKLTDEFERLPKPLQKIIGVLTALSGILLALTGPILMLIGWLPNIISGMKIMKTLIPAVTAGMKGLTASFAPLLIGGAIIAGLMVIIKCFKELQRYHDLANADISKITDPEKLKEEKKYWEKQLKKRREALAAYSKGPNTGDKEVDKALLEHNKLVSGGKLNNPKNEDLKKKQLEESVKEAESKVLQIDQKMQGKSSHSSDKEFVCPTCGKKFKTQAELDAHMKTHTKGSGVKDERTAYEKAQDQFDIAVKSGASAESQLAKWNALTKPLRDSLKGKELDDYTAKLKELEKASSDAIQKAQNELLLAKITDAQENELKQLELSYKEQTKGMDDSNKEKIAITEKYNIERQRITERWGKEKLALEKEIEAIDLRSKGDYEAAALAEEEARYAREINDLTLNAKQKEKIEKDHQEKVNQIRRDYAEQRSAVDLEKRKGELDIRIQGLEAEKQMAELIPNELESKQTQIELEKQIVELKKQQLDLDIKDLGRQQKATEDPIKKAKLQNQIDQDKLGKASLQSGLDYDIANYNFERSMYTEVHDSLESAIRDGFEDGKNIASSFADYLGDVLKQKVYKAMADAILNSSVGQSLTSLIGNIVAGMFGGGKTAPVGTNSEGGAINAVTDAATTTAGGAGGTGGKGWLKSFLGSKTGGAMAGMAMGAASNGGQLGAGATLGSLIGMIWGPVGSMVGGMLGGLLDGGGGKDSMTVKASSADMEIEFAEANFKNVTLPSSYQAQGTTHNTNSVAPIINISVSIPGGINGDRELERKMRKIGQATAKEVQQTVAKWPDYTVNGVSSSLIK
jgi:TP901 family phage tail tape measure protein